MYWCSLPHRGGERKFAEACQKIQESVERYLERHDLAQDTDEDEDEDDLEEGAIIGQLCI